MNQSRTQRIVVTGIGVISPNGIGREAFARSCREGVSGLCRPTGFDASSLRTTAVAQVRDFDLSQVMDETELRRVPRMVPLAIAAAQEAIAQAKVDLSTTTFQREIGVALGSGGGGLTFIEEQYRALFLNGKGSLFAITAGTHGNLSSEISIALGLRGLSHVLSTGCTSSTDAIGYAMSLIRAGTIPMMLAGGADAPISMGILNAFERMRVVSTRRWDDPTRACRPFSLDRDGFVLGEGAWMFVLESAEHAKARGVQPLAELAGYASTCDAYHRVQIDPELEEPVRAMQLALADAGLGSSEIDYINLHGTGTELNDRMESAAVRRCFGDHADNIPMSSTKSMIGHPQGACGAAGLAATILAMRDGIVHPTLNLETPDPACDLDYVPNQPRPVRVDAALCNCIAFGSKNSALVVRRA